MLTRLQIQDNIDALEEQGASQQEIQEWLDSLPKQSEAPAEPPKKDGILKTLGKALISSELKFGKSIADALPGFVPGSARWTIKQNEEIMKGKMETMDNRPDGVDGQPLGPAKETQSRGQRHLAHRQAHPADAAGHEQAGNRRQ